MNLDFIYLPRWLHGTTIFPLTLGRFDTTFFSSWSVYSSDHNYKGVLINLGAWKLLEKVPKHVNSFGQGY